MKGVAMVTVLTVVAAVSISAVPAVKAWHRHLKSVKDQPWLDQKQLVERYSR